MLKKSLENDAEKYNLYWPIYQNIENEFLNITDYIRFEDKQLKVYSNKFIDLLLRICVEIESISKQLYLDNGGENKENERELYFDTVCLNYLEEKWQISEKLVQIVNMNMFFSQEKSFLYPLKKANKRGTSGSKWKRAYQAIKHNRGENYFQGNLENCLNGLAALYLLNIYYKNMTYELNNITESNGFDLSQGSRIFAIKVCKGNSFDGKINKESSATYFINYTEEFLKKAKENNLELNRILYEQYLCDDQVIKEIKEEKISLNDMVNSQKMIEIIGIEKFKKYINIAIQKSNMPTLLSNQKFTAFLNKERI